MTPVTIHNTVVMRQLTSRAPRLVLLHGPRSALWLPAPEVHTLPPVPKTPASWQLSAVKLSPSTTTMQDKE